MEVRHHLPSLSSLFNIVGLVLSQLRCAGIPSLLTLMHSAYPSRHELIYRTH